MTFLLTLPALTRKISSVKEVNGPSFLAKAIASMAAFPTFLTSWNNPITLDAVTTATPLGLHKFEQILTGYGPLFFGNVSGSLGETSALALIVGGLYLLIKKIMCNI